MAQQIKVILSTTFRGYAAVLPQSFVASVAITANMLNNTYYSCFFFQ